MPRVRHQITACDGPDRRPVIRIMAAFVNALAAVFVGAECRILAVLGLTAMQFG
jgi:hypothetical protein